VTPVLDIHDLAVEFTSEQGTLRAVDGVSLSVERGEVLGLVGESGSGKSVTMMSSMKLIRSRRCRIVSGKVLLNGRSMLDASPRDLRRVHGREVGIVFQDPMTSLNPTLTVGVQITEAIRAHQAASHRRAHTSAVELLDEVGVAGAAQRQRQYPHEYSGGMRQRTMLAMALANRPSLLIADEPTTALDATVQAQILDLLRRVRETHEVSIVLITHDLRLVAELADRVAVMYGGRIVELSAVDELFTRPAHPYTAGLLGALPQLGERHDVLPTILGEPFDPFSPPAGCSFHPRCVLAQEQCRIRTPELTASESQRVACFFPHQIAPRAVQGKG